jgi:uncharacterized protein (UPF0332 family)
MTSTEWIEAARIRCQAATVLLENGYPSDALTRAYFSVFSAGKALLISRGLKAKTHRGAHTLIHKHLREEVDTALLRSLQEEREDCDYRLLQPSSSKVKHRLQQVQSFVEDAEEVITSDEDDLPG